MEQDPVCGMLVEPSEAAGKREFAGRTWYFCSADCLAKFDRTPLVAQHLVADEAKE